MQEERMHEREHMILSFVELFARMGFIFCK